MVQFIKQSFLLQSYYPDFRLFYQILQYKFYFCTLQTYKSFFNILFRYY